MLVRFTDDENTYIARAGDDHTYFDLGATGWDEAKSRQGLNDQDIFTLYNVPFLDDAVAAKKPIDFSHDPERGQGSLRMELIHLRASGYEYDRDSRRAIWVL